MHNKAEKTSKSF